MYSIDGGNMAAKMVYFFYCIQPYTASVLIHSLVRINRVITKFIYKYFTKYNPHAAINNANLKHLHIQVEL